MKYILQTLHVDYVSFKNKPIQNFNWEEMGGGVGGGTWCASPGSTSVGLGGWMFDALACLMINI